MVSSEILKLFQTAQFSQRIQVIATNIQNFYSQKTSCSCLLFIGRRSHRVPSTSSSVYVARKRVFRRLATVDSRCRSLWDEGIALGLRAPGSDCHRRIIFLIWNSYPDSPTSASDCFAGTDELSSRQNWSFQFDSGRCRTDIWQWEGGRVEWHPGIRAEKRSEMRAVRRRNPTMESMPRFWQGKCVNRER